MIAMDTNEIDFGVPAPRKASPHDDLIATLAGKAEAGQWNLVTLGSEAAIRSFRSRLRAAHPKAFSTRLDPGSVERLYVRKRA